MTPPKSQPAAQTALQRHERIFDVGPFQVHAGLWHGGDRGRLLLLHGLGGNSITWDPAGALLAARLRSLAVAIDCPGFGPSHPRGQPLTITRMLEVAVSIMEQLDDHRPWTILGNSMGGFFGLRLARMLGRRVDAVVLASPALPLTWGRDWRQLAALCAYLPTIVPHLGRRLFARYNRKTGLPGVVDNPVRALFFDADALDPQVRERLIAVSAGRMAWVDEASRAYEQITRDLALQLATPRALRGVLCPVQVIHGQTDRLFPVTALHELRRMYPKWRYATMARVGHVPQLEAPERFVDTAVSFVDELWRARS